MAPRGTTEPHKKTLKDLAKENPSQLGDPVSLKAETSNTEPTEKDRPTKTPARAVGENDGKDAGDKSNRSQLGDPVSLKGEPSSTEPTEQDRGAKGASPGGKSKL